MAPSDTDLRSWVSLPPELPGWRGAAVWPELRFSNSERRRGGHWARRRSQRRRLSDSLLPPVLLSRTHLPIHPSRRRSFAGFMLDGGDPAEEVKPSLLTASPGLQGRSRLRLSSQPAPLGPASGDWRQERRTSLHLASRPATHGTTRSPRRAFYSPRSSVAC
ncbi:unnamed protein product [Rangifer tarandus platyrhynchus]|uniref:Uncharacterized protein n=1 Tax=Rangifer tarandus platyrhynchus TaxID=3082113 RepID=A0AC60A186_RANTA